MARAILAGFLLLLVTNVRGEEASPLVAKAKSAYYKESIDAIDAYLAREKVAREKMSRAYDLAITAAMKQGAESGLELANQLKEEKKDFIARQGQLGSFKMEGVDVPDKKEIIKNLTAKQWTWRWNGKHDERVIFSDDGLMRFTKDSSPRPYTVTPIWVIAIGADSTNKSSPYLLIMNNDDRIHGFKVRDGGSVGAFVK